MDLQIAELDSKVIGQRLGQKLYSQKGGLLLGMGTEIGDFHFRKIQEQAPFWQHLFVHGYRVFSVIEWTSFHDFGAVQEFRVGAGLQR